jgi:lysophospholipase L1-like esterase
MTRSKLWQASVLLFLLTTVPAFGQSRGAEHWVGTWSNAVVALPMPPPQPAAPPVGAQVAAAGRGAAGDAGRAGRGGPGGGGAGGGRGRLALNNQTLRQIVHTSIGGDHLRVVLTNAFGSEPLIVDAAFVALHVKDGTIGTGGKPLVFAGRPSITIPAGAVVVSDAVDLKLAPFSDLAIDLHVPGDLTGGNSAITMHGTGLQTNYLSAAGNVVGATEFAGATTSQSVYLVSRVEVLAPPQTMAIAAFGDSITDGTRSTPNTNHRWPDVLARRLEKQSPGRFAVLNAAIAGNRLLAEANGQFGINALARFDRDVLVQPGVTHVIVMEGINDIGMARDPSTPTALDIIAAQKQLIERAHAKGLKVIGATLTPFEGAAYFTPEGEAKRKAVNDWIRTSKAYDSVIDFDAVVRDTSQPTKFQAAFDSGDHLHPNDAGYQAMGNAVDLKMFAASR